MEGMGATLLLAPCLPRSCRLQCSAGNKSQNRSSRYASDLFFLKTTRDKCKVDNKQATKKSSSVSFLFLLLRQLRPKISKPSSKLILCLVGNRSPLSSSIIRRPLIVVPVPVLRKSWHHIRFHRKWFFDKIRVLQTIGRQSSFTWVVHQ